MCLFYLKQCKVTTYLLHLIEGGNIKLCVKVGQGRRRPCKVVNHIQIMKTLKVSLIDISDTLICEESCAQEACCRYILMVHY